MSESESQSTEKKPGRKPSVSMEQYEALLNRVEKLEACLSKIATDAGQGNTLRLFGLSRVEPTSAEMRKYA